MAGKEAFFMGKKTARITGGILLAMLIVFTARGLFMPTVMAKGTRELLSVNVLKVGRADAIIVDAGIQNMVIDTGEEDDGAELIEKLGAAGIDSIDTLVITHYDKDHVGGADQLIKAIPVDRVIVPDYDGNSTDYTEFMAALEEADITPERVTTTQTFSVGDAAVIIEPPASYELPEDPTVEYDNNFSLITTVVHGDNRLLFMGDAEKERIVEWMASEEAVPCTFLKVPHHGVYNSELDGLFEMLQPAYAVITDSAKNPADTGTIELLEGLGTKVFETLNGRVEITSNGTELNVKQ